MKMFPKLFSLVNCSLKSLSIISIATLLIGVDCNFQIDESNIWIPIFDNNIGQPLFMFHQDFNFVRTEYSSIEMNKDPAKVGPGGLEYNFTKAYPMYINSSFNKLFSENNTQIARFEVSASFSLKRGEDIIPYQLEIDRTRWIPAATKTYETISVYREVFLDNQGDNRFTFILKDIEGLLQGTSVTDIDSSMQYLRFIHGFMFEEKTYWFGLQLLENGNLIYFISQLTRYGSHYIYKELYSPTFEENYGSVGKVQFVFSHLISSISSRSDFSKLLVISYTKDFDDSIVVFSFDKLLKLFDEIDQSTCYYSEEVWSEPVTMRNGSNCIFTIQHSSIFMRKKWQLEGFVMENFLHSEWNRIIDFVPLSLVESPNHCFLVLSSDIDYSKYRYSVHFIENFDSPSGFSPERIFNLAGPPNESTKIYYFPIPVPQALIVINHYHYSEVISLCPMFARSCLECITQPTINNDQYNRYCSWTFDEIFDSGVCLNEDTIDPGADFQKRSLPREFSGYTLNPCFKLSKIVTFYLPEQLILGIDLDLSGYDHQLTNISQPEINLISNLRVIGRCTVTKLFNSLISANCTRVTEGHYKLLVVFHRNLSSSPVDPSSNIITISDTFSPINGTVFPNSTIEPTESIDSSKSVETDSMSYSSYLYLIPLIVMVVVVFGIIGCTIGKRSRNMTKFPSSTSPLPVNLDSSFKVADSSFSLYDRPTISRVL